MKFKVSITVLSLCVVVLSLIAATSGIFTSQESAQYTFTSLYGQTINIFGKGIYAGNSVSAVLQAVPQDIVTLIFGIPILIIALYLSRKGSIKGRFMLSGTLCYFLITYCMYTFIAMYNRLFLVYVLLMSTSFFAFILSLMSFDLSKISSCFSKNLPVRFVSGYLLFSSFMVGYLWLARTIPTLINGSVPLEVEHGSTLPVQAFDLAFFLPAIFLSGLLLIRRKSFGYLLAPVATFANVLIMAALLSKGISMTLAGIPDTIPMMVMTSLFEVLATLSSIYILRNITEPVNP